MTTTAQTPTIKQADTRHVNASQDYAVLREEAVRLARRIYTELDQDIEPIGVNWAHVGDMARIRTALRELNDLMFLEGEYAE